jgi:putative transposase
MSSHSYSRCWLHLIWATLDREPMLTKPPAAATSKFLSDYALKNGIYMKINFVNPDHVHTLIDLPTNKSIEEVVKLFKGSASHFINAEKLLRGRFAWGRGYGAFSVSHSDAERVAEYIATQEEHHKKKSFDEEYELFIEKYGLEWRED